MAILNDEEESEPPSSFLIVKGIGNNNIFEQNIGEQRQPDILPLGKALHLLLNVKAPIIDKALAAFEEAKSEKNVARIVVVTLIMKAIYSIDRYLGKDENVKERFFHLYEPLKKKVLLKDSAATVHTSSMIILRYIISRYQVVRQHILLTELQREDKKSQLAVIILLRFVIKNQPATALDLNEIAAIYLMPLIDILKKQKSRMPTYLSSLACELATDICRNLMNPSKHNCLMKNQQLEPQLPTYSGPKIVEVVPGEDSTPVIPSFVWRAMHDLILVLKQWHKPTSPIEKAAYNDLLQLVQQHAKFDWGLLWTYFTAKTVLCKRPFSIRKQKILLEHSQHGFFILCLFEHRAGWIEQFGNKAEKEVCDSEYKDSKPLIQNAYRTLCKTLPSAMSNIDHELLIPQLIIHLPNLCTAEDICNPTMIKHIFKVANYSVDLIPLIVKRPELCLCYLIRQLGDTAGTDESTSINNLLKRLIHQNSSEKIMTILEKNLLTVVEQNDNACKLLIDCMPYLCLPVLIEKLSYKMLDVLDMEREKFVYSALISKALLQEKWAHYSILWYIEFVRKVEVSKCICFEKQQQGQSRSIPPSHIYFRRTSTKSVQDKSLVAVTMQAWMTPIQLWSVRMEDIAIYAATIRQLVAYCYGLSHDIKLPDKLIWIPTWQHLSFGFMNTNKSAELVPVVLECCLKTMIDQNFNVHLQRKDNYEKTIFLKLCPMLILQCVQREAFSAVELPTNYVITISDKLFQHYNIDANELKTSTTTTSNNQHAALYIQLFEELLNRAKENESAELGRLGKNLVTKIFFK